MHHKETVYVGPVTVGIPSQAGAASLPTWSVVTVPFRPGLMVVCGADHEVYSGLFTRGSSLHRRGEVAVTDRGLFRSRIAGKT